MIWLLLAIIEPSSIPQTEPCPSEAICLSAQLSAELARTEPRLEAEIEECQLPHETRPLTLCLAERSFERADARLNAQWAITYPHVKTNKGQKAANKLRQQQREWIKARDGECEAVAAPTPSTQQGRNLMGCMAKMTDQRTAVLIAMTGKQ